MISCSTNATFKTYHSSNNVLLSITTSNDTRSIIYKNELKKKGIDFSTKTSTVIFTAENLDKSDLNIDPNRICIDIMMSSIELPVDKSWINPLVAFELKCIDERKYYMNSNEELTIY